MRRKGGLLATDEIPYNTPSRPMWYSVSVVSSHVVRTIKSVNAHAYFLTPTPRRSLPYIASRLFPCSRGLALADPAASPTSPCSPSHDLCAIPIAVPSCSLTRSQSLLSRHSRFRFPLFHGHHAHPSFRYVCLSSSASTTFTSLSHSYRNACTTVFRPCVLG